MNEPVALYEQVKRHITDAIVAGEYTPGAKLPSESALVETLSVSRMTVNRALRELTRDGVITRLQGVGSFVSQTGPSTSLVEVRDIKETIVGQGAKYACKVLQLERNLAEHDVSELLELQPDIPIMHAVLLHFSNGQPLQLERRYVREDFAPKLLKQNLVKQSLFGYLQSIAPVSELEHMVEATPPDKIEMKSLKIDKNHPVLRIRRRTWVGSKVVTLGYFSHPGDLYRVTVRVKPSDMPR